MAAWKTLGYPLLYPTLFVLGMVGYYKIELCVPDAYTARRRRPALLAVPRARTNLLQRAPLTRALRTLNALSESGQIDIFNCTLNEFTRVVYCTCSNIIIV
ncbi:hypothetical protein B5X24_HaOG203341 [Helicoverpa armigera]|nr:hypothetical protein B5X24_HaOG203341 [Helicoverpa armigera]